MKIMHCVKVAVLVTALIVPWSSAHAGCSVTVASPVNFSPYDAMSQTPAVCQTLGTITVDCRLNDGLPPGTPPPNRVSPIITISAGKSGAANARAMDALISGTTYYLNYNLYADAACANYWSDIAVVGPNVVQFSNMRSNTAPRSTNLYGKVPELQNAYVGLYTDNLVVTITY